ncbi:hypothetical protein [Sphingobacterium siyangense]|uniref:hypothetical protein n=1 Tax=Sphingobacterium siyangense TaxID=459529 RepID=UPI003C789032
MLNNLFEQVTVMKLSIGKDCHHCGVHKKENLPFLNPAEFVKENLQPFDAISPVVVTWDFGKETVANIFLASRLIAKLTVGSFPGWSSLVTKDGPLAQKM